MKQLKISLYCATDVGLEMAQLAHAKGRPIACGILDDNDSPETLRELRKLWADIPVFTHRALAAAGSRDQLRQLGLDLAVLAWWPHLLPPDLAAAPRLGCLNFHPSLLPHNRGKHPNFWALVEERPYGVSLHFLGDRIDAGDIAFQQPIPTTWSDTGGALHQRAKRAVIELFAANLDRIWEGDIPRQPQDLAAGSFHLGKELELASQLDLDAPTTARKVLNLLRARTYPPHPAAWFQDQGTTYEVRVEIRPRHVAEPAALSEGSRCLESADVRRLA